MLVIDVDQLSENCWRWQILNDCFLDKDDSFDDAVVSCGYCQTEENANQEAEVELQHLIQSSFEF